MEVTFTMPDRLAERLEDRGGDLSKRALESVVADAYREEVLTLGEVREVLGHSTRLETEQFLKDRGILLKMTDEELEEDARTAREARSKY
jgi:predicted HTH domain antitoxin